MESKMKKLQLVLVSLMAISVAARAEQRFVRMVLDTFLAAADESMAVRGRMEFVS